jgi:hypothetical protein
MTLSELAKAAVVEIARVESVWAVVIARARLVVLADNSGAKDFIGMDYKKRSTDPNSEYQSSSIAPKL